ncbi:hypothetical protein Tsubulata_007292 [Turnera subulata]|uniref:DUF4283 domain-containing protein n=1 Tax=Turnera subulata TaxID=218843 RepID=A0A9Q0FTJ2_9ROSI|nr:hypothetical protein Tsubulata_007292 [Turnera subulata]
MGDVTAAHRGGEPARNEKEERDLGLSSKQKEVTLVKTLEDTEMEEQPMSYLDKLKAGRSEDQEEPAWLEDEEDVEVEPGDIIIGSDGDIPTLDLSMAFQKRLEQKWEQAVIVKLLGRNISYRVLTARLKSLWQPKGLFKVRFPDIPLHTYHPSVLLALGDLVGEAIRIDHATREHKRGRFAKIAVEVDLTKPLKGTILFMGKDQKVIYEGLPTLYYQCGSASHTMDLCPQIIKSSTTGPTGGDSAPMNEKGKDVVGEQSSSGSGIRTGAGAWMNAPVRPRRTQPNKPPAPMTTPVASRSPALGSRYEVLGQDLDKDGGAEAVSPGGIGPWVEVAQKKGPKPKKTIKKSKPNTPQSQLKNPTQLIQPTQDRTPLIDITNKVPTTASQDLRVNQRPITSPPLNTNPVHS